MKWFITLVGILLMAVVLMAACASQPSGPVMTFQTIGTEGATVFVTLVSPSADAVSPQDLANRLRQDWQNHLVNGNAIEVMVFDNTEAPKRWIELWPTLASLSDQEWAKEQAQIFPHWIANYWRNKTTGFHQVEILSRDANGDIIQTIKF